PLEQISFGVSGPRQVCRADTSVGLTRPDTHEAVRLQRTKQAAEVAGVEREARAKLSHVTPLGPYLPENARLSQRPVAREVAIVERPDTLGDEPVEAADPADMDVRVGLGDSLILVRDRGSTDQP